MLTRQEIFNTAYHGLMAQGCQSLKLDAFEQPTRCAYRGENGTKCAIGMLISDEEYDSRMDSVCNSAVDAISSLLPKELYDFYCEEDNAKFLKELQNVHDMWNGHRRGNLKERFDDFAANWNLEMPK